MNSSATALMYDLEMAPQSTYLRVMASTNIRSLISELSLHFCEMLRNCDKNYKRDRDIELKARAQILALLALSEALTPK